MCRSKDLGFALPEGSIFYGFSKLPAVGMAKRLQPICRPVSGASEWLSIWRSAWPWTTTWPAGMDDDAAAA